MCQRFGRGEGAVVCRVWCCVVHSFVACSAHVHGTWRRRKMLWRGRGIYVFVSQIMVCACSVCVCGGGGLCALDVRVPLHIMTRCHSAPPLNTNTQHRHTFKASVYWHGESIQWHPWLPPPFRKDLNAIWNTHISTARMIANKLKVCSRNSMEAHLASPDESLHPFKCIQASCRNVVKCTKLQIIIFVSTCNMSCILSPAFYSYLSPTKSIQISGVLSIKKAV